MLKILLFLYVAFVTVLSQFAFASDNVEMTTTKSLTEFWGEDLVWWHGRASFSGEVIIPACTLSMEDAWQVVDMGETPVRELHKNEGAEKKFLLRLRNCELIDTGKRVFTGSRVRVTFEGHHEDVDKFLVTGQASGISLQIIDKAGYPAYASKAMPPIQLTGNEQGLDYRVKLVKNGSPLSAGYYYAALRFKVDYE